MDAEVMPGESVIGGGSTPGEKLPTWLIAIRVENVVEFEKRLRSGDPAVVARVENDLLLLDLRTVLPAEEPALEAALNQARAW